MKARINANLDASNKEKEKDAAIAEADSLMAGMREQWLEVVSEAASKVSKKKAKKSVLLLTWQRKPV